MPVGAPHSQLTIDRLESAGAAIATGAGSGHNQAQKPRLEASTEKALEGKVALVTGGGSGMGRASSLEFAAQGAKVVVADYVSEGGERTAAVIRDTGGEATFVQVDVSNAAQVEAMIKKVVDTYGRLDCAHNNAGIEGQIVPAAECSVENWNRIIATNLTGVWLCLKYEIVQMLKQGRGAIVNTASAAGLKAVPGFVAYCASKHGVVGVTKVAAMEYAKAGIRINAVCPVPIDTPMLGRIIDVATATPTPAVLASPGNATPIGRNGKPEEVARVVAWLCTDAASYVTGVAMPVDGGYVV
jgi:NAD(P)-dependent dehydrogenase (short-subunit alcohol dehydrogenase family)